MTTCAVYLRISKDKGLGTADEGLGVERQEQAIRKMLAKRGWNIGPIYRDNDVSASGKVPRPEYDRMLADYAAGEFEAIAAMDHDRLTRRPVELEHLIELNTKQGLLVATVSGDVDFTTPNGILFARFRVNLAADELLRRSTRQKAKFAQDREAGKDHWRGRRPFGLTLEGKEVPEEAQAIRDIAEIILNDGTMQAGVALLHERGIKTTFNKEWKRQPLRRTMMNPRLAGLLEHEGELLPGKWDAVLNRATWEAVVAKLSTPGRPKPKRTEHEYFLSGLLTCSECGGKCYGRQSKRPQKDGTIKVGYIYRCEHNHVSKELTKTDDLVILRTLEALWKTDTKEVQADKEALKKLREARAHELKDWEDWKAEAAEEGLRPSEIRPARDKHEARLKEIDAQLAQLEKVSLVRVPTLEELAESTADDNGQIEHVFNWDQLTIEKRRSLVANLWESITLVQTGRGARWDDNNILFKAR
ncbi:recombinase family protein [Arthrobacter sp. 31Y]|uniref:recombinase family protein n=1 Tax=Arthrobacter sp. 31Y TaxID=1115632 RepID=UPI000463C877|nr:recombinase family protein [Arthrobacter sp. 31Y]